MNPSLVVQCPMAKHWQLHTDQNGKALWRVCEVIVMATNSISCLPNSFFTSSFIENNLRLYYIIVGGFQRWSLKAVIDFATLWKLACLPVFFFFSKSAYNQLAKAFTS